MKVVLSESRKNCILTRSGSSSYSNSSLHRWTSTGLSKRNGAKLRASFSPAAASYSRPCQAAAQQNGPFFLHKPVLQLLYLRSEDSTVTSTYKQTRLLSRLFNVLHCTTSWESASTQCNAAIRHMPIWFIAEGEARKLNQCLPFMENRFAHIFSPCLSCYAMLEPEAQIPLLYHRRSSYSLLLKQEFTWPIVWCCDKSVWIGRI